MDIFTLGALVLTGILAYVILFPPKKEDDIRKRLEEFSAAAKTSVDVFENPLEDEELKKSFFERVIKPALQAFANAFSKKDKSDQEQALRKELAQAGNPGDLTPNEFKALKLLVMILFPGLFFLFGLLLRLPPMPLMLVSLIVFVLSFLGPRIYIQRRIKARKAQIVKTLPDCLDLLCVSVEAGLGFDIALAKVQEKFKGALAEEIRIVLSEIQMGKPRREALKSMAEKMEVDDLTSFVSAVVQADQLGVSVSKVLKVQSQQAREKRRQRAEEQAMTAPIKMMFPLVGCIFPTIMIVLLGGAGLSFFDAFMKPKK